MVKPLHRGGLADGLQTKTWLYGFQVVFHSGAATDIWRSRFYARPRYGVGYLKTDAIPHFSLVEEEAFR
ncbi:hypothetical protein A7P96_09715 [Eikenella sp. NML03-A-027]|nr:hypothetical protein A7P96_09715 [Eikenella sp. NML03-A-027]